MDVRLYFIDICWVELRWTSIKRKNTNEKNLTYNWIRTDDPNIQNQTLPQLRWLKIDAGTRSKVTFMQNVYI